MMKKVKCNMCEWTGREEDLISFEDEDGNGKGCPKCKTDSYLIDVELNIEQERKINEYGSIQFDKEKVVGVAKIKTTISLTEYDIDCIMVTAIEGGIGYWARLDNVGKDWEQMPKNVASSQWATTLLLEGKSVRFEDIHENNKVLKLTLEKLIKGVELNHKNRPHDNDIENGDAITVDCVIQFALFGETVYG